MRKVLLVITAVLAFVGLAAAPSAAQYGPDPTTDPGGVQDATLDVDQGQVSAGCNFTLYGDGFDPNTTYEIGSLYLGTEDPDATATRALPNTETSDDLGTVTTDADGSFTQVLPIAPGAPLGFYGIGIDTNIAPTGETGPNGEVIYSSIDNITIEVVAGATCDNPVTVPATPGGNTANNAANNANNGANNGANGAPGVNDGTLARTGSTTMPLVAAGLGLLAAGGGLLLINKRRNLI